MDIRTARSNDDPDLARWGLLALALVIGSFLMVYYVQLLHDSVARGAQTRYSQATSTRPLASVPVDDVQIRMVSNSR